MAQRSVQVEAWTNSRILITAGAAGLFSLLLVGPLIILFPWADWLNGKDAAAWIQAIGSVVAILAAVTIAYSQNRQQRELFEHQMASERQRSQELFLQAEDERKRQRRQDFDTRDLQHRRVAQATSEVVAMFRRAATLQAEGGIARLNEDEVNDLRFRLRAVEDARLSFEFQITINELRDLIGTVVLKQSNWVYALGPGQNPELAALLKRAIEISRRANDFLHAFRVREMREFGFMLGPELADTESPPTK